MQKFIDILCWSLIFLLFGAFLLRSRFQAERNKLASARAWTATTSKKSSDMLFSTGKETASTPSWTRLITKQGN